jgi:hypothetical protein
MVIPNFSTTNQWSIIITSCKHTHILYPKVFGRTNHIEKYQKTGTGQYYELALHVFSLISSRPLGHSCTYLYVCVRSGPGFNWPLHCDLQGVLCFPFLATEFITRHAWTRGAFWHRWFSEWSSRLFPFFFCEITPYIVSGSNAVGRATTYWLDGQRGWSSSPGKAKNFHFSL